MLRRVIPQSVPNPIPVLIQIRDKIIDIFEPQPGPDVGDFEFELEEPKLEGEFELDSLEFPSLDSLFNEDSLDIKTGLDTNIVEDFKRKLDSLLPDTTAILDKAKEQALLTFKQMADEIVEAVSKGLKPIKEALPKGEGGCNCLAANFNGLSFGIGMGGGVNVGSMIDTAFICDNINVIRRIVMVFTAVTCIGMVLATLRGGR
jgi:hypothetical protein